MVRPSTERVHTLAHTHSRGGGPQPIDTERHPMARLGTLPLRSVARRVPALEKLHGSPPSSQWHVASLPSRSSMAPPPGTSSSSTPTISPATTAIIRPGL
jgi:hypothetical protein